MVFGLRYMVNEEEFVPLTARQKRGQARRGKSFSAGFSAFCSEPVPFFGGPLNNRAVKSVVRANLATNICSRE
jgi:hypothetical protein